jgi:tetratricopeptide (TPR) repeat protein
LGFWEARGIAHGALGEYEQAGEEYSKAVGSDSRYALRAALGRACALLGEGRIDAYHQACAELVEVFRDSPIAMNRAKVAELCSSTANPLVDYATVLEMVRTGEEQVEERGYQLILGGALYRDGQYEEASRVLSELVKKMGLGGAWPRGEVECRAMYFLSMVRQSQGHDVQARRWLQEANELCKEILPPLHNRWYTTVKVKALRQEATSMMEE